jgi:uncharacterized protein YcbX
VHIRGLWRYPVKSMQGEACTAVRLSDVGVVGDRSFGVLDVASQTIVSAKRDGRLLEAAARFSGQELLVMLPTGDELGPGRLLDERLSEWLGRSVRVVPASGYGTPTFEGPDDFEREDLGLHRWDGQGGSFVDESPLHLVTTTDLAQLAGERPDLQWDIRRFRPNMLVESPDPALALPVPGQKILVGDIELKVTKGCTRCVMTTRAQPGGIERQLGILRHVIALHDNQVGFRAAVTRAGAVRVGDTVTVTTSTAVPAGD